MSVKYSDSYLMTKSKKALIEMVKKERDGVIDVVESEILRYIGDCEELHIKPNICVVLNLLQDLRGE